MNVFGNDEVQQPDHSDKYQTIGSHLEYVHCPKSGRETQSQEDGGDRRDGQERDVHCRPTRKYGHGKVF